MQVSVIICIVGINSDLDPGTSPSVSFSLSHNWILDVHIGCGRGRALIIGSSLWNGTRNPSSGMEYEVKVNSLAVIAFIGMLFCFPGS